MPSRFRLTRSDFKALSTQKTRRVRGVYCMLAITPLPVGTHPKIACIVAKKAVRKATDRNRIKRRCREIVRLEVGHIKKPVALALYANAASVQATFDQLRADIHTLLCTNNFYQ